MILTALLAVIAMAGICAGQSRTAGDVASFEGTRFRFVPQGVFVMGSPKGERGRIDDQDQHEVVITHSFWMSETEVTQRQWQAIMKVNPSEFPECGEDCPVDTVSWYDAIEYANELSARQDLQVCYSLDGEQVESLGVECQGYRLPTEAEWEYAARAGTATAIYSGKLKLDDDEGWNSSDLGVIAWYWGNSGVSYSGGYEMSEQEWKEMQHPAMMVGPHAVGTKVPNAWGLYDILGNVTEWCWDDYQLYDSTDLDQQCATWKVVRGCSWNHPALACRSATRFQTPPVAKGGSRGFRLVRSVGRLESGDSD